MNYGYYQPYQPVCQPPETFKQWCKRGSISKRDKSFVKATGWFVLAYIAYSTIYSIISVIDLVLNGISSYLSPAQYDLFYSGVYPDMEVFESTVLTMVISIFVFSMLVAIALYILMGIGILNYSKGWTITFLVFMAIGFLSSLISIPALLSGFVGYRSYYIIQYLISFACSVAGAVLSILAINALSRAKKQWEAEMYAIMNPTAPQAY